jgi:hypothetical protein
MAESPGPYAPPAAPVSRPALPRPFAWPTFAVHGGIAAMWPVLFAVLAAPSHGWVAVLPALAALAWLGHAAARGGVVAAWIARGLGDLAQISLFPVIPLLLALAAYGIAGQVLPGGLPRLGGPGWSGLRLGWFEIAVMAVIYATMAAGLAGYEGWCRDRLQRGAFSRAAGRSRSSPARR